MFAPDAFIQAYLLHRTLYRDDDSDSEQETSGHDAATKAMIDFAVFASQVAYKLASTNGAERAEAYERATYSFNTRVYSVRKALRRGQKAEGKVEDDEDSGDGGDTEDAMMADAYGQDGAQDTTLPEEDDVVVELQAQIMQDRVLEACTEKLDASIVPGLRLRVEAHVEQHVLPGLDEHVDARVVAKISDLEARVDNRVDTRIEEYLKAILRSDTHPLRNTLSAIVLPQLAAPLPSALGAAPPFAAADVPPADTPDEGADREVKRELFSPHPIISITRNGLKRRVRPRAAAA